jgi:hypothetical protein
MEQERHALRGRQITQKENHIMITLADIDQVSLKCHRRRIWMECKAFFLDPENMKRFEEWKEKRDAEQKAERMESIN